MPIHPTPANTTRVHRAPCKTPPDIQRRAIPVPHQHTPAPANPPPPLTSPGAPADSLSTVPAAVAQPSTVSAPPAAIAAIGAMRAPILLLTLPCAALWARGLEPTSLVTGPLLVVAHAAVTLLWMTGLTRAAVRDGLSPRLGLLTTHPVRYGRALDDAWLGLVAASSALALVTLFVNFWIGLGAVLATIGGIWRTAWPREDRHSSLELLLPGILLAAPATLFAAHDWPVPAALRFFSAEAPPPAEAADLLAAQPITPALVPTNVLAASWLAAAILAVWISLCLLRDRPRDLSDGVRTMATRLGRGGAIFWTIVWIIAASTLAVAGAGSGWWGWGVALVAAWSAIAAVGLLVARRDELAALLWCIGGAITSLTLLATTV